MSDLVLLPPFHLHVESPRNPTSEPIDVSDLSNLRRV